MVNREVIRNRFKLILFCLAFMLCFRAVTAQTCGEYCINITYTNGTCRITPDNCTINDEDWQAGGDVNCTDGENVTCCCYPSIFIEPTTTTTTTSITGTTTTTYAAIFTQINIPEKVFMNDIISGVIKLENTNNITLSAQHCTVSAYENDTNRLIKAWPNQCYQGEPYLDNDGIWQVITKDCKLTDSAGYYYFTDTLLEADGFQSGRCYNLMFTCNRITNGSTFCVDVAKPPDVWSWFAWMGRYPGIILVAIIVLMLLALLIYIAKRLLK